MLGLLCRHQRPLLLLSLAAHLPRLLDTIIQLYAYVSRQSAHAQSTTFIPTRPKTAAPPGFPPSRFAPQLAPDGVVPAVCKTLQLLPHMLHHLQDASEFLGAYSFILVASTWWLRQSMIMTTLGSLI
jgi:hypothetical protein